MASKPFYEVGRYEVEAVAQGFTKTKTGNTQFVIRFKVKGKINPDEPDTITQVRAQYERTYYRVLTEKTIEYFTKDLEALGVEIGSFTDLDPENPEHVSLAGKAFDAYCNHEANQDGDLVEKWSIARMASSKPIESVASSQVKNLDRMFGRHLKKSPSAAAPQRRAQPAPVYAEGVTDDDIPF